MLDKIATFLPLKFSFWREILCFANPVLRLLESVGAVSCRVAGGSRNGGFAPLVQKHQSISEGLWMGFSGRKWRHTIHLCLCQSVHDRWSLVQQGFSCNPACPAAHLDTQADGVFVYVPPFVRLKSSVIHPLSGWHPKDAPPGKLLPLLHQISAFMRKISLPGRTLMISDSVT